MVLEEREAGELAVDLGALGLEDVVEGVGLKPSSTKWKTFCFEDSSKIASGGPCHFARASGSACAAV